MLIGTMLAFFSAAIAITFQLPLIWWCIPVVSAIVVLTLAVVRYRRHRRMREASARSNAVSGVPVVMDVDTGIDDAFALMFAVRHPGIDLRAVTCVAGNASVDHVVANTCYVLDAAGAGDIPVGRGAAAPLLAQIPDTGHFHGHGRTGRLLPAVRPTHIAAPARSTCCATNCSPRSATASPSPWCPPAR